MVSGDVKSPTIRLLALQLLVREGEKRPDMLRQRVCAGVKEAYLFQQEIIPHDEHVTAVTYEADGNSCAPKVECIFGLLYKECLSSSKAAKQALFKSLIKIFISFDFDDEYDVNNCSVEDTQAGAAKTNNHKSVPSNGSTYARETAIDLPFLCYVSQILAHLPYNASMDPLFIIYHVSNAIIVHGEPLLYRIARFLAPHYAVVGKAEDREDEDVDILEEAAKSKAPCRTKAARVFESPNFDLEVFAQLCTKAASIILLIRLKQFLKKVYSLSETRCMEYAPNDKERISDRSINTPEEMPVFNNKFEPCIQNSLPNSCQTSSATKKDALIHVYAEFRHLMRKVGSTSLDEKSAESKSIKHTGSSELTAVSKCKGSSQELTSPSSVTEKVVDDNIGKDEEDNNMKSSKKRRKSSRTPPSKAPSKRSRQSNL
jgi:cohesin loading factor subunit SCC2